MFVGHLGVGLIGKRIEPKISLGIWMLAVMLPDLVFFPLSIVGLEKFHVEAGTAVNRFVGDVPYSHSLLMDIVWGALFAASYYLRRRYPRGAWMLFGAVLSHWVLDVIAHRPDMQLAPGIRTVFGWGLWNSIPATLTVEGGFWIVAIVVYVRATSAVNPWGVFFFWAGIILLTLSWYSNIRRGMDPDPVRAGVGGLIFFSLMIAWAHWMNRIRTAAQ
jgi:hypothetical protein